MPYSSDCDVFLIGGHSTVGKSTVARELGHRLGVPVMQVDDLRLALQRATKPGQIEGLHFFQQLDLVRQATPDERVARLMRIGEIMSDALEAVIAHHVLTKTPIIIEGDGILPKLAAQATCDGVDVRGRVKSVFIVEPDEGRFTTIRDRRWPEAAKDADAAMWLRLAWSYGQLIAYEASALDLPVINSWPIETLADRVSKFVPKIDRLVA